MRFYRARLALLESLAVQRYKRARDRPHTSARRQGRSIYSRSAQYQFHRKWLYPYGRCPGMNSTKHRWELAQDSNSSMPQRLGSCDNRRRRSESPRTPPTSDKTRLMSNSCGRLLRLGEFLA